MSGAADQSETSVGAARKEPRPLHRLGFSRGGRGHFVVSVVNGDDTGEALGRRSGRRIGLCASDLAPRLPDVNYTAVSFLNKEPVSQPASATPVRGIGARGATEIYGPLPFSSSLCPCVFFRHLSPCDCTEHRAHARLRVRLGETRHRFRSERFSVLD